MLVRALNTEHPKHVDKSSSQIQRTQHCDYFEPKVKKVNYVILGACWPVALGQDDKTPGQIVELCSNLATEGATRDGDAESQYAVVYGPAFVSGALEHWATAFPRGSPALGLL
jgi:hypothetical protein